MNLTEQQNQKHIYKYGMSMKPLAIQIINYALSTKIN